MHARNKNAIWSDEKNHRIQKKKNSQRIISKIHSSLLDFRGIYFKIYREFPFDISYSSWYKLICLTSGKAFPVSLYDVTGFSSNT